jgi:hypothetical protein
MNNCRTYRELFVDAALGDLSVDERTDLEDHLNGCSDCRTAFRSQQDALMIYREYGYEAPAESYWIRYVDRLRERQERTGSDSTPPFVERLCDLLDPPPLPVRIALAAVIFSAGVLLGRVTVERSNSETSLSRVETSAVADATVEQFLTRAHTLFLSIANTPDSLTISVDAAEREAAERLLRDADVIRGAVDVRTASTLANLIDDAQIVLMHMANPDAQASTPMRETVEEFGLLLRINLYLMDHRRSTGRLNL